LAAVVAGVDRSRRLGSSTLSLNSAKERADLTFPTHKNFNFQKLFVFYEFGQKRLSMQLAKDTMVSKSNCKELGPVSACGKELKNRKLISPWLASRTL
jgi:hypothetical protein